MDSETEKHKDPAVHKNKGITRVLKAFGYSLEGIASSLKHEAAFRQEAIFACILVPVSCFLHMSLAHHLILVASVLLVLIVELINSAIEAVVDDISLEHRPLAKRAKDIGSAAVFFSLLNCLICWVSVIAANWAQIVS